jgi:hypothetical protein
MSAALQLGKRQIAIENTTLIKQFIASTIDQDSPIPRSGFRDNVLGTDVRSAIARDGVVPFRPIVQLIHAPEVFQKSRPNLF